MFFAPSLPRIRGDTTHLHALLVHIEACTSLVEDFHHLPPVAALLSHCLCYPDTGGSMDKDSLLRAAPQKASAERDNGWFLPSPRISLICWLTAQKRSTISVSGYPPHSTLFHAGWCSL